MEIYRVGGAVRDQLLGKDPSDIDYAVTGATPEQMEKLGYTMVGADFPVFLHPETKDEYALARIERKTGKKHTDFESVFDTSVTIEDDLKRRDLTINAIAINDRDHSIIVDPFNGREDIKNKVLRHVSDAFREDPLRVLRLARFTAKFTDFTVADETVKMVREMVKNGELNHLSPDRIWMETKKAFLSEKPSNYIAALDNFGALQYVFPDILKMKGVPQRDDYHAEGDVFIHNQMVLDAASKLSENLKENDKLLVRFGAAFHDIGKAYTPYNLLYNDDGSVKGLHHGHDGLELVSEKIKAASKLIRMPSDVTQFIVDVASQHQNIHAMKELSPSKVVKIFDEIGLKNNINKNYSYISNLLMACHADSLGRKLKKDGVIIDPPTDYPQAQLFIKYANKYLNTQQELAEWMQKYKERNEKNPEGLLIKAKVTEIRVNEIKKIKKQNVKP